jgi:hypothetical protein
VLGCNLDLAGSDPEQFSQSTTKRVTPQTLHLPDHACFLRDGSTRAE